jgi:Bacteriodetes cell division protein (FtsL-like)
MSKETTVTPEKKNSIKNWSSMFMGGKWITDNINFFLFLSVLAVLYIANGHVADKTIRDINKTQKEIKQLQFEYKTVKSELMYRSEESQVLKAAEPLGLQVSKEVPMVLTTK